MDKIYIVLLKYNGWKDTIEYFKNILKSEHKNCHIIVVNNSLNSFIDYINILLLSIKFKSETLLLIKNY